MDWLQFGNDENVNFASGHAILKVQGHSLANVFVKFVDSFALREEIFLDSPRAPKVAVVIHFDFH